MSTTWNPSDNHLTTLSNGNHTATSSASVSVQGVRGTLSHTVGDGKYYLEYTSIALPNSGGAGGIGFLRASDNLATVPAPIVGVQPSSPIFFQPNARSLPSAPDGHTVCLAIDLINLKGWVRYDNGSWFGTGAGGDDPATNTNGNDLTSSITAPIFPSAGFSNFNGDNSSHATLNAGDSPFIQTVPVGFVGWDAVPPPNTKRSFATVMS